MRYEANVTSPIGPLGISALQCAHADSHPVTTRLTIVSPEPIPLAELLLRLDELDIHVHTIRCRMMWSDT